MKKARIVLTMISLALIINVFLAVATSKRGLNNLYFVTTGVFIQNGSSRLLTYGCLAPYRTFATAVTQPTTTVAFPLYSAVTFSTTIIGGQPYTYTIVTGNTWNLLVYDDEDQ